MGRTRRLAVGAGLLGLVVLAGCGGATTGPGDEGEEADAPAWFTDRPALPPCPAVTLDQGEVLPDDAVRCLEDGRTGDGAELAVVGPTVEGDPIRTWYRVRPGEPGLDVVVDATGDLLGVDGWTWSRCPEATAPDALGPCTTLETRPREG